MLYQRVMQVLVDCDESDSDEDVLYGAIAHELAHWLCEQKGLTWDENFTIPTKKG